MQRREFLLGTMLGITGLTGKHVFAAEAMTTAENKQPAAQAELPRRRFGKTTTELSIVGMGGIVVMNAEPKHAKRLVAGAIAAGVNYFDVAPSYGDAELKLGPALKPYRSKVFLACKTTQRTRAGARPELEASLKLLDQKNIKLLKQVLCV